MNPTAVPRLLSLRRAAMQIGVPQRVLQAELERRGVRLLRLGRRLLVDERDLLDLLTAMREPTVGEARARADQVTIEAVRRTQGEEAAMRLAEKIERRQRARDRSAGGSGKEDNGVAIG